MKGRLWLALWILFVPFALTAGQLKQGKYQFREGTLATYSVESSQLSSVGAGDWIKARSNQGNQEVELGSRIFLQAESDSDLSRLLSGRELTIARNVRSDCVILQARNAKTAAEQAAEISREPGVVACAPVMRRPHRLHGPYAGKANDPYTYLQWNLEHRNGNGTSAGVDLNVRAAWPYTRGEGVVIAIADDGVEYTHPEFVQRAAGMPHFHFGIGSTNGLPDSTSDKHATAVAGLAVAERGNGLGGCGVAPGAGLASWKLFSAVTNSASDEQLMDMFQYCSNSVAVQNHSWGRSGYGLVSPSPAEMAGIGNAIEHGRNGLGVVIVRAVGNDRVAGFDGNEDAYNSDPRVIAVGAVRFDGRVASYSTPGACILVSAPSGDTNCYTLFTTDRQGVNGYNTFPYYADRTLADYVFESTRYDGTLAGSGFTGTSAAAPQIAGVAALILSVNTNLSYRDVQQILVLSSRHFDFADPGLTTNAAGLRFSHNVGYGVPDAGVAVTLAAQWHPRPPLTTVTYVASEQFCSNSPAAIPDDGLRVVVSGSTNSSLCASPSLGLHPDAPTENLELIDVGLASGPISSNLTGKAALIQRGGNAFTNKIDYAVQAGARMVIIYNNVGTTERVVMANTDFLSVPVVFIGKNDGDGLHVLLQQTSASVQLKLNSTNYAFFVTNTMACEHVAVRLQTDHTRRADLRVTLVSPSGARSVLQRLNNDVLSPGPLDWTYYSTHHFFESSYGQWTLCVSDEASGATGSVRFASLKLYGVSITDSDHDSLDDQWELANFGNLSQSATGDPDCDGYNNIREFVMQTNPGAVNQPMLLDCSMWDKSVTRLSWPGVSSGSYEIWSGIDPGQLSLLTNVAGQFPVAEWFVPATNRSHFFQVRANLD